MSLASGARVGSYEIIGLLGMGGMGEVYRARDSRLQRDVAIKTLPEQFASDPDRVARFEREARVLASLNHPHIASIYGVEETNGASLLVLELVEGATLAERLERGALDVDDALELALQIAEALEAAHGRGIIHRDLKPANIKLTADGKVKVLDFGLAKTLSPRDGELGGATQLAPDATNAGAILGTAEYMSPEQACGQDADKRSDIWAFGCVLHEMLAGERAFEGHDAATTLSRVLRCDIDRNAVRADTPPAIRRLLKRCLTKELRDRLPDIAVARLDLADALRAPADDGAPESRNATSRSRRQWLWPAVAALGAIAGGIGIWLAMARPQATTAAPLARFVIGLPQNVQLRTQGLAISPNGREVVFSATDGSATQLYRRSLEDLTAKPIAGTENARSPLFSPDGKSLAFVTADDRLEKVSLDGRSLGTISTQHDGKRVDVNSVGRHVWAADDTIVFMSADGTLWRVAAGGGEPQVVRAAGNNSERYFADDLLPGDGALGTRGPPLTSGDTSTITELGALSFASGKIEPLVRGDTPRYLPSGHLLFWRDGTVWAARFDAKSRKLIGEAIPVVAGVASSLGSARWSTPVPYDVGDDGSLVFVSGESGEPPLEMVWVDRAGREEPLPAPARAYWIPRVSPVDQRVAVQIYSADGFDLWIMGRTLERLTSDPGDERDVAWSPDGRRIAYYASRLEGGPGIFVRAADGTGAAERLTTGGAQLPQWWSADGRYLVFVDLAGELAHTNTFDLFVIDLEGDRTPKALAAAPGINEAAASLSPDGRWLALESDQTGSSEIFVQKFPEGGRQWRVSAGGGLDPVWGRDGKTLYYRAAKADSSQLEASSVGPLTAVAVRGSSPDDWETSDLALEWPYYLSGGATQFDAAPDGRLLALRTVRNASASAEAELVYVQNFAAELERLLPAEGTVRR